MFYALCESWWIWGLVVGFIFGAGFGWDVTKWYYRRKLNAVLAEFRRATKKPALTLDELLDDVKRLGTPIGR